LETFVVADRDQLVELSGILKYLLNEACIALLLLLWELVQDATINYKVSGTEVVLEKEKDQDDIKDEDKCLMSK
jgi:hypothetical protein